MSRLTVGQNTPMARSRSPGRYPSASDRHVFRTDQSERCLLICTLGLVGLVGLDGAYLPQHRVRQASVHPAGLQPPSTVRPVAASIASIA